MTKEGTHRVLHVIRQVRGISGSTGSGLGQLDSGQKRKIQRRKYGFIKERKACAGVVVDWGCVWQSGTVVDILMERGGSSESVSTPGNTKDPLDSKELLLGSGKSQYERGEEKYVLRVCTRSTVSLGQGDGTRKEARQGSLKKKLPLLTSWVDHCLINCFSDYLIICK